jgi:heme exporter protein A
VPEPIEETAAAPRTRADHAALVVRGLDCRRGERPLFAALDFDAPAGAIVWIRGANGQGKTTLLRTLAGLSAPSAGSIARRGAAARWPLLYLAHANALKEDLTVAESLAFLLRIGGNGAVVPARVDAALQRFGMLSRRHAPVRTLSQGQRRRVALARLAASSRPAIWLLDEPYDALDADGAATLDELLAGHAREGGILVLTSHLPVTITAPRPVVVQLEPASASAAPADEVVAGA